MFTPVFRPFTPLLVCAVVALAPAPRARAEPKLAVDAAQTLRTVDARHFGVNAVMWDGQTGTAATQTLVQAAGLGYLRIPGGSLSDAYDWSRNKSYASAGVLNTWTWSAGMREFTQLANGSGARLITVVNYGSGTPEMAAAWVAYQNSAATLQGTGADVNLGTDFTGADWRTAGYWSALRAAAPLGTDDGRNFLRQSRTAPLGCTYWEIGNECYGSWENDYHGTAWNGNQGAAWDPVTYANAAKNFIAKMKAVDPSIKIGVVVQASETYLDSRSPVHTVTNPRTGASYRGWTPVLLATLKTLGVTPDFLIYHRYEQIPGQETDAALLGSAVSGTNYTGQGWAADAADLRRMANDYLGTAAAAGVELVVTENNLVYSDPGKQSVSVVNALFYADSLANVLKTELRGFFWWALRNGTPTNNGTLLGNQSASLYGWRNYGDYGVISSPNSWGATDYTTPYPVYYAMKLMSRFARAGDTIVQASSDTTSLPVYAARRADGTLALLVINKSATTDQTATVTVAGFAPSAAATTYAWGIPQDEAARTGTGSKDVATGALANAGASFTATFAKYSATVITLAPSTPTITTAPRAFHAPVGATATFSVVAGGAPPLTYQWKKNGADIAGATGPTLTLANVQLADAADFTVTITNAQGSTTSTAVPLVVGTSAGRVPAISMRARVGTGSEILVPGLVVGGSTPQSFLIRALGPKLNDFGIPPGTFLADPLLKITTLQGAVIAQNDDWGTNANAAAIVTTAATLGAQALTAGSKDAVLLTALAPGVYTPQISGVGDTTGVSLVEFYNVDAGNKVPAISMRARVGTGSEILVPGLVVEGSAPKMFLIRALGPKLNDFGIPPGTFLADPLLKVTKLDGTVIAQNDNWEDGANVALIPGVAAALGAQPLNTGSKDAVLLIALPPGVYTPQISGVGETTGVCLVEFYNVE